ncbi:MBOAT family protein [Cellulophaga sp. HaHaR_3_176]|uniref:MBOAT family O-acyltransferase n=1 Tax=Cellulophaga sp. HaHaR_3_176 TaxID=1942464 RepID=UPI001C2006C5|nr:MBOAT family O-acyltransferase [Cellulophaga sp. HaHaR_3_176]QWX84357.1 MBOAT family protein [Cellulophaga sp. HaHaR_3_176]
MLFNSWEFIILLLITTVLYYNLKYKHGILLLFISSYCFYSFWRWDFAVMMLAVSLINFFAGIKISKTKQKVKKKAWLVFAVLLSILPLVYFKYMNFLIENVNAIAQLSNSNLNFPLLDLILPVGISFFTFQALSYTLDVYYKKTEVETNVLRFSTFVAFFPQLVAGPIERSSNLLNQLKIKHQFKQELVVEGVKLFVWGLFKKVVIADRLAIYVNNVYESPDMYSGLTLVVATIFFAFQIYCDFSGYSDMAIGTARILGFKLMQNFNLPYLSSSISDFWKRWHISLSSWFGDYVYKPLGGSRVVYLKWIRNILVVFLISGVWHGANWTFIIWGALHALFYFIENWGDLLLNKLKLDAVKGSVLYKGYKKVSVFIFVCFAWIFFRANSLNDAFLIIKKLFIKSDLQFYLGSSNVTFLLSLLLILLLIIVQIFQYKGKASLYFSKSKANDYVIGVWYLFLLLGISTLGLSSNSFIYFQF